MNKKIETVLMELGKFRHIVDGSGIEEKTRSEVSDLLTKIALILQTEGGVE